MKLIRIVLVILGVIGVALAGFNGPPKRRSSTWGRCRSRTTRPSRCRFPQASAAYAWSSAGARSNRPVKRLFSSWKDAGLPWRS